MRANIWYMYLMDYEMPSYRSFGYFVNVEINGQIEDIFPAIMEYIRKEDCVDLEDLYIDGSKFEANVNKYPWVWKKGTENPNTGRQKASVAYCHTRKRASGSGSGQSVRLTINASLSYSYDLRKLKQICLFH